MNVLDRYIMRNFLLGMFPVMLLLLVLFSFMALAEELEDVGQGLFTQFDAFMVVLYTAPRRIVDMLPVTTRVGGLMGLGVMASHQELLAARVAGMSTRKPPRVKPVVKRRGGEIHRGGRAGSLHSAHGSRWHWL